MRGVNKNFPSVKALQGVDFTLRKDEIRALMGENGAGKSTLTKMLTGVEEFETGIVRMEGSYNTVINRPPQEVQENGINTVYQEMNLCPNLSVAENLYIGKESEKGPMVDWKTVKGDIRKLLGGLDVHIDVTMAVENYSIAAQQITATTRAADMLIKVLILDGPTFSLNNGEIGELFMLIRQLRAKGIGIILVAHFLEQAYAICDRITVLRSGALAGEFRAEELPRVQLVAKMMGKDSGDLATIKKEGMSMVKEDVIINARELGCKGTIKPFSLDTYKDEVVGLTGPLDSGRSGLVQAIYGADKPDSGKLAIKGKKLKVDAPIDAMMESMVYLSENREGKRIIADLPVRENIIITLQAKKGVFKLMSRKEQEEFTDKYIDILQVKIADRETPIKQLSSGNQ